MVDPNPRRATAPTAERAATGVDDGLSGRNALWFALAGGLWVASLGNWPLWLVLARLPETASPRGVLFGVGFFLMIAALLTALLCLFAWRRLIRPATTGLVVSAAIGAYFMGTFGIVLDPSMMLSVVQTDPREVSDLLSVPFVLNLLGLAVLPLVWLWRKPVARTPIAPQAFRNVVAFIGCMVALAALVFALFADLSATMRNHRSLRYMINPVNGYFSLAVIARESTARPSGPLQPIGVGARQTTPIAGARPPMLVLVIGETARADHFSLNGYARPTNPELSKTGVLSFSNVTSCGTNTAASLPCMFSPLARAAFGSRERDSENLLDLAEHVGLAVLWVDNQSGCKGLCDRVPHAAAIDAAPGRGAPPVGLCSDGECYDEALLSNLDARLAALPSDRRERGVLIVLHQMGSHGPAYFKRSPPERKPFRPECATTVMQECSRDEIVNAYDNSIAYTDHVLASTIQWLGTHSSSHDTALLYVSDHGESLGENNIYLHGLPYALAPREQTHVPMVAWFGGDSTGTHTAAARLACLRTRRDLPLTHDHLFHTVLGLFHIQATEYERSLDAFAGCVAP